MMTLLVVVLMILSALVIALPGTQGREYGMNPAAVTSSSNIQPNPTMNVNISWSTYHNGWKPLEYSNGTGNQTLNARLSSLYANPISINPTDLQSTYLTNSNTTGIPFNDSSEIGGPNAGATGGTVQTKSYTNGIYTLTENTSLAQTYYQGWVLVGYTSDSQLPSNNLAYDYFTIAYSLSGPAMTGVSAQFAINNASGSVGIAPNTTIYPGQSIWESAPLSDFTGANFNTSASSQYRLNLYLNLPQHASTTYTIKMSALMLTTSPLYLGNNASGPEHISINPRFSTFDPNFSWQAVDSSGYSVAVSQPLQNLTTQQSAINSLSYIEQVEYQGQFNLPTAPDLSYGTANLTEHFDVNTSQTQVLDINGVSYLSTISGKNGTIQLVASVNPNGQTQFLQIVDYTQSQWTSISSPPGIFTLAGIEYYWEEFIIAILAIVGVGAGAASRHASNLRKVK